MVFGGTKLREKGSYRSLRLNKFKNVNLQNILRNDDPWGK